VIGSGEVYSQRGGGKIETMLRCGREIANSLAGYTSTPQNQNAMLCNEQD
jgi:hypothetical protein